MAEKPPGGCSREPKRYQNEAKTANIRGYRLGWDARVGNGDEVDELGAWNRRGTGGSGWGHGQRRRKEEKTGYSQSISQIPSSWRGIE